MKKKKGNIIPKTKRRKLKLLKKSKNKGLFKEQAY